jgi:hypothetical protein
MEKKIEASETSESCESLSDLLPLESEELEAVTPFDPEAKRDQTKAKAFRFHLMILHRRKWTLMHEIAKEEDFVRRLLLIKSVHEVRKEALR